MPHLEHDIDSPAAEDLLGRRAFAQKIAGVIQNWKGQRSLVIGIFGPWGSGKTTAKDFLLQSLEAVPTEDRPVTVDLNAWEWNGLVQMTEGLFQEIAVKIGRAKGRGSSVVATRMKKYSTVLTTSSSIARSLEVLFPFVVPGSGTFFKLLGEGLEKAGSVAKEGGDLPVEGQSLLAFKAHLVEALRHFKRNVVVMIDDVDRLMPEQLGHLFQLLKVNGDLPRLVYVVMCDREVVERALDRLVSERGSEFLKKIIQVGFDLPAAPPVRIEQLLVAGLMEILQRSGLAADFDYVRWENAFSEGVSGFFRTMRDVKRFLASLEFMTDLIARVGEDFDLTDFILIEVLRVFEPALYARVLLEKEVLTGRRQYLKKEDIDTFFDDFIHSATNRNSADVIIRDLFPRFRGARYYGSAARDDAAIAQYDAFDRYFAFAVPEHDYSSAELREIVDSRDTGVIFLGKLREGKKRGGMARLLSVLATATTPVRDVTAYAIALAKFADEVAPYETGAQWFIFNEIDTILWSYFRAATQTERGALLVNLAQHALATPLRIVGTEDADEFFKSDSNRARDILRNRLRQMTPRELAAQPHLYYVLRRWAHELDDSHYTCKAVQEIVGEDSTALLLLRAFAPAQVIEVGRPRKRHGTMQVDDLNLSELMGGRVALRSVVSRLSSSKVGKRDRQMLREYTRVLESRDREQPVETSSANEGTTV